jgi:hypothetical protein
MQRLSIAYLLVATAAVAIGITVARAINDLYFLSDARFYGAPSPAHLDLMAIAVSSIYGLSVATWFFAIRSGHVWQSPGKMLAMLFGAMCLINWGLDTIAGVVTAYRVRDVWTVPPILVPHHLGYIGGIWYRSFAVKLGYPLMAPFFLVVMVKARRQPIPWQITWWAFFAFDLAMITASHNGWNAWIPRSRQPRFVVDAIGLPMICMAIALLLDVVRRRPIDWWTMAIAIPSVILWGCVAALS